MASLSKEEQRELLRIAKDAVAAKLGRRRYEPPEPAAEPLREPAGAFVTLHIEGRLRGCIGTFQSSTPLFRNVAAMALSAAFSDPRFRPLTSEELPEVDWEISVLTPMRRVEDLQSIEVGRHGLYVVRGYLRGVLLPQVAVEYGWDRETFLSETCCKAGLPRDAWRSGAEVYAFEAQVFGGGEAPDP